MDNDCLVMGVVSKVLEEDSPTKQGELESLDIDVRVEIPPGISSYDIGYDSGKETVQVSEEEDGPE